MKADLGKYLPAIYEGILETDKLMEAENYLFSQFYDTFDSLFQNQFIMSADEEGIEAFEQIYGIVANPGAEPLAFRRERVLNRASMRMPFTLRFLRERLDAIIGPGKYTIEVDYDNYTLFLSFAAREALWYNELNVLMTKIKPCNILYINKPYLKALLHIQSTATKNTGRWNYRLGEQWQLGLLPFTSFMDTEVIKMPEIKSTTDYCLNRLSQFNADMIHSVLINGEYSVSGFINKSTNENNVHLEIMVNSDTPLIQNIKLLDAEGATLYNDDVSVPVSDSVYIVYDIEINEGV